MTEENVFDGLGFQRSLLGESSAHASKKSAADAAVRFSLTESEETTKSPQAAGAAQCTAGKSTAYSQSMQKDATRASQHSEKEDNSTNNRKPTVLLGPDGKPLPILKGARQFGYLQARRLAEHLRVKFAVDRNQLRFYCPDTNEQREPPPATSELKLAVRGFLKTSKKIIQETQELSQTANAQLAKTKNIEEELTEMTQEYVGKLELRKQPQKSQPASQPTVVVTQAPRRRLCCM